MARPIVMMAHASTPAMRKGMFPTHDDASRLLTHHTAYSRDTLMADVLDERAREELAIARASETFTGLIGAYVRIYCAPADIALASAYGMGFTDGQITVDSSLAAPRYGAWAGKRAMQIAQDDPAALQAWTRDPLFAPPGGETFDTVCRRMTVWLATIMKDDSDTVDAGDDALPVLAIASAPVVRAAVLLARRAQRATFHQIEVAPGALFVL